MQGPARAGELIVRGEVRRRVALAVPLWVIYPKAMRGGLSEAVVRGTMRRLGFVDTKVAAVSATLTALRFVRPPAKARS